MALTTSSLVEPLVAGGIAGTAVDVTLFPIDTIKTRVQTEGGFKASGGFRGVWRGLGAAALGSAPNGAIFFVGYEAVKPLLRDRTERIRQHLGVQDTYGVCPAASESMAAGIGEVAACVIRVPTENVKQRMQVSRYLTSRDVVEGLWRQQGIAGFYTGFATTVAREMPFCFIQLPLWEELKRMWARRQGAETTALQGAACGSVAGAIAGGITNPVDVIKTRLMTEGPKTEGPGAQCRPRRQTGFWDMYRRVVAQEGHRALLRGMIPRVMWISMGGFVFFGSYEVAKESLVRHWTP